MTRLARGLLLAAFAALPFRAAAFTFDRTIPNPTPAAADHFGAAVALVGGNILVGAPFDDLGATNAGAAYLFDASFARMMTIPNPVVAAGDDFGFAVAALGPDLLVSAPETNGRAGAIYRFNSASPVAQQTFALDPPRPGAKLGFAIAALGADVLAGAPYDGDTGSAFLLDGQSGAVLQTFASPTPGTADLFGYAVAAAGSIAVIAAPYDDTAGVNAGAVHLFDATTGVFLRTLVSPRAAVGDDFGLAVAAGGNQVLVGSPHDHSTPSNAGAAYLFDATTGALLQSFVSPAADARFGSAVAINGGTVLVGAPLADGITIDVGRAYAFDATTGALLASLENPTPAAGDQFGAALAFGGGTAVVGAWLDGAGAAGAGAVHRFLDTVLPTTTSTTSTSTSTTTTTSTSVTTTTGTSSTTATSSTVTTVSTATTAPDAGSTTTGTVSSFTSTTSEPGQVTSTTVTTTVPVPTCATGCDDGDLCTVDACDPDGGCGHEPATGFDAVTCRLESLDGVLHTTAPLAFGGPRPTARLRRKLTRVRVLVEAASRPAAPLRRLVRAERALAAFMALVRQGELAGRIAHGTAADVLVLSSEAATALAPLRRALR